MLLILQKVDPESKNWLSRQLAKIENKVVKKELEKKLKRENWDYVHKLGIIQSSIYGVDIQPIAVEISKLRFFLSLVVDEKINDKEYNRGIDALPNLEFKFVAANSLVGLPHTAGFSQTELFEARDYIKELKNLRDAYFTSYGHEKLEIEQKFQQIQDEMFEYTCKEMVMHKKTLETQTLKLSQWKPFSHDAASWFDPEWMFGVKEGFNVVIANPPYKLIGADKPMKQKIYKKNYKMASYKINTYILFLEKGLSLLTSNESIISYIIPKSLVFNTYLKQTMTILLSKYAIPKIVEIIGKVFEYAEVGNNIIFFAQTNSRPLENFLQYSIVKNVMPFVVVENFYNEQKGLINKYPAIEKTGQIHVLGNAFNLDPGEKEAISLCIQHANSILLTDDTAARLAAKSLNIRSYGTIGILLRAIRRNQLKPIEVISYLEQIPLTSIAGGEGGIRTLGTFRHNGFRDRPVKPLRHLSEKIMFHEQLVLKN